jgi:hypothetical protein
MSMKKTQEEATGIWKVIAASSAGTLIEWYDFYIFGSLATIIAGHFFPKENATLAPSPPLPEDLLCGLLAHSYLAAWAIWWDASTPSW